MPHFILEYSDNILEKLDHKDFFTRLHSLLVKSGPFRLSDIKSRVVSHSRYHVAEGGQSNGFVHLSPSILSGRDLAVRQAVGNRIMAFLRKEFARSFETLNCSITLEIKEIDRDTYVKEESGTLKEVIEFNSLRSQ